MIFQVEFFLLNRKGREESQGLGPSSAVLGLLDDGAGVGGCAPPPHLLCGTCSGQGNQIFSSLQLNILSYILTSLVSRMLFSSCFLAG